MTRRKLRIPDIAVRLGIKPDTWSSYVSKGLAPKPDGRYDARTPWWWSTTIDRYQAGRAGRGSRTDLTKPDRPTRKTR